MGNKVTISILSQILSERTGKSRKECEDTLRSFFHTISNAISAGETVKVKGFGTFKISQVDARMSVDISSGQDFEIPAHNKIVFLPSRELANAVNAPFEMFETIELAENITEIELQDTEREEPSDEIESAPSESDAENNEINEIEEMEVSSVPQDSFDNRELECHSETIAREENDSLKSFQSELQCDLSEETDEDFRNDGTTETRGHFGRGFIWGMIAALLILLAGGCLFYILNENFSKHVDSLMAGYGIKTTEIDSKKKAVDRISEHGVAAAENIGEIESGVDGMVEDYVAPDELSDDNPVPTKPSDMNVYDTIRPHSGLGVMARKHYGNYHFWPYIYKENEKILGHPDRITPGTRVIIPPLSKYGVNAKSQEDIAKAKKLDAEIYGRYKKSQKY